MSGVSIHVFWAVWNFTTAFNKPPVDTDGGGLRGSGVSKGIPFLRQERGRSSCGLDQDVGMLGSRVRPLRLFRMSSGYGPEGERCSCRLQAVNLWRSAGLANVLWVLWSCPGPACRGCFRCRRMAAVNDCAPVLVEGGIRAK